MSHMPLITEILSGQLGCRPEKITSDARLQEDLGCDSLDFIELVIAFERELDTCIEDEEAEKCRTVADIDNLLSTSKPRDT